MLHTKDIFSYFLILFRFINIWFYISYHHSLNWIHIHKAVIINIYWTYPSSKKKKKNGWVIPGAADYLTLGKRNRKRRGVKKRKGKLYIAGLYNAKKVACKLNFAIGRRNPYWTEKKHQISKKRFNIRRKFNSQCINSVLF